jgi:hypothetical protein
MSEVKFSNEGNLPLWRVDQGEDVRVIFENKIFQTFTFLSCIILFMHSIYAAEILALRQRFMPCREFYVKSGHKPHG